MGRPVLLLNGPPGVGKTTAARFLAARTPGTVCIHGDELRAFAPADARDHLGPGSTYRAAAALVAAYDAMGATAIVVDYCFLDARHVAHFVDALCVGREHRIVTLWAPLAVCDARDRARAAEPGAGRSPLAEKIAECWRLIEAHRAALGTFINVDGVSRPAVADALDRAWA